MIIPALLAKKANAPGMMRISREEETFIGRARPGFQGRMKVGFSKEGRILAVDMFVISDNGPYDAQGDAPTSGRMVSLLYQPQAMRWRGVTVLTNTPPRSAQSSPGGMQGISIIEPIVAKAARKLGLDQVAIRYINCPEGKAPYGPLVNGQMQHATSAFLKEALQRGAEKLNWTARVARSPKRIGSKVRGVGVSLSCYVGGTIGLDGLLVITPDGRVRFQSGIGNLGTESVIDVQRAGAEALRDGLEIGALTTLAEIVKHPAIREKYGLLAEAAELIASPQIRNQGAAPSAPRIAIRTPGGRGDGPRAAGARNGPPASRA
jgi:CO/xanthine dehydrogenase Mo-binding subunit